MSLIDIILTALLFLVLTLSAAYIIKAKKKGKRCIGCPYSDSCALCKTKGLSKKAQTKSKT